MTCWMTGHLPLLNFVFVIFEWFNADAPTLDTSHTIQNFEKRKMKSIVIMLLDMELLLYLSCYRINGWNTGNEFSHTQQQVALGVL
jgi:hypothetical protein